MVSKHVYLGRITLVQMWFSVVFIRHGVELTGMKTDTHGGWHMNITQSHLCYVFRCNRKRRNRYRGHQLRKSLSLSNCISRF